MMLQIDHRESHDVDLFLDDPQLLPYLDPQKQDFKFETAPTGYGGDGTGFLKITFEKGEIDFIVGQQMTKNPTQVVEIEGVQTLLETIPEIITKKIIYRGRGFTPRDIFDLAAAGEKYADPVIEALRDYPSDVLAAQNTLERLKPDFTNATISQLMIRDHFLPLSRTAIDRAKEILAAV